MAIIRRKIPRTRLETTFEVTMVYWGSKGVSMPKKDQKRGIATVNRRGEEKERRQRGKAKESNVVFKWRRRGLCREDYRSAWPRAVSNRDGVVTGR